MAREEQDREDILREATALVERAEMQLPWLVDPFVFGFRRDGSLSTFFGPNEVYQFNSRAELRRGYDGQRLLKAEGGQLVHLTRYRTDRETQLRRSSPSPDEQEAILQRLETRLATLEISLRRMEDSLIGEVTQSNVSPRERLVAWLSSRPTKIRVAQTPRVD